MAYFDTMDAVIPKCWKDLSVETEYHSGIKWGWFGWVQTHGRLRVPIKDNLIWC